MDDAVLTSVMALGTAVLVALWSVGGWAALERRTMQQELDIAARLGAGMERDRLEQLARDRAALYAERRLHVGPSASARRRLVVLTLALPVLVVVLSVLAGPHGSALAEVAWVLMQVAVVVLAGLLGYWGGLAYRLRRSSARAARLERVRADLTEPPPAEGRLEA